MDIESFPETRLAARLARMKGLTPPINILPLAKQYAKVNLISIPYEVDGISLNLKVPGKQPHIIINENNGLNRIRFTLAHELGHVLIPWHIGTIVDNTLLPDDDKYDEYWRLEAEANRFASELLMPSMWVNDIIEQHEYDLYEITMTIVNKAAVSPHSATIKIKDNIKTGYIFAALNEDNVVISSGRSKGTIAKSPLRGIKILPKDMFPFCTYSADFEIHGIRYNWWFFDENIPFPKMTRLGDWRFLLDEIVKDIGIPPSKREKYKQSVNGVIAAANARVTGPNRTKESLYSAILQRIHGRSEYMELTKHKKFTSFIQSRIYSLLK